MASAWGFCFLGPESSTGQSHGVGVVTPLPVSATVGPPGPVLSVPCLGPVPVGAKVTEMRQTPPLPLCPTSVGGQLLVWV